MWGAGSSVTISDSYTEGLSWNESFSVDATIGGVTVVFPGGCLPSWLGGACWPAQTIDTTTGAQLSAESDGYIGIEAGYAIDSGSINASYPVAVELTYPDPSTVSPGETFTISSEYAVDPTAGFDTNFAEIEAYVDAVFDVYAHVDADAYLAGSNIYDISPTLIDQEFTMEVVGFNRDGDGQLSILGDDYALGEEVQLTKYTDMKITIPDIETTSTESPPDSDTYTSTGETEFLQMGWDYDTMATQAIYNLLSAAGVPASAITAICPDSFLAGDILDFIYYDILDIDLGLEWDIMQSFLWEPELIIKLATSNGEEYTFAAGDSIELEMPDSGFDITPTFVLNNTFTNNTDLAIVPEIELTYLDFSIPLFDLYVGPYPTDGPLELPIDIFPPINVYNGSFPLGFDPFTMASFSIAPLTGPGAEPIPEPATMLLVGSGLIGLAGLGRRKKQKAN